MATSDSPKPNVKDVCFFKSPINSWVLGTVKSDDGGKKYTCVTTTTKGTCGVTAESLQCREEDVFVIHNAAFLDEHPDDLLQLVLLHDCTLMHALNQRYFKDVIYTYIGPIVVAFNPFKFSIEWYKDENMPNYLAEGDKIVKNKPHTWSVAHNTYYEMVNYKNNHTILVSGESGAGKTEAVKIVLKYLSAVSSLKANAAQKTETQAVGRKLLQASPIMEGFGNAKTVRNDNSSRFGKFMKVQFTGTGILVGAHTIKYLLEKSRVVTAGEGERVYHSFYYIAASPQRGNYGLLNNATYYKSLSSGKCIAIDGVDDSADFNAVMEAMGDVGISDEDKVEIWKSIAGMLTLLNVGFTENGEGNAEIPNNDKELVRHTASLWKIDPEKLIEELLLTRMLARGEWFTKYHTLTAASTTRDAMIKAMYDELFDKLVAIINSNSSVSESLYENWIGLLDIFGFEDFKINSFEQLCINLTNETLQHHYNYYIFTKDQEECREEGVDITHVEFPDNTPCLKLIKDKMGIVALLDEECQLGKATDMTFLEKVTEEHKNHPYFIKDRFASDGFGVRHYAADVTYRVQGFLDKNRDTLKDAVKDLVRSSKSAFIAELLPKPVDKIGKKLSVGGFFSGQLDDLMAMINSTLPHWIRCVKTHPAKKPLKWDGVQVLNQLTSSGIIGTVKVRKAGFPIRMYFLDFVKRFRILRPGPVNDMREKCVEIVAHLKFERKVCQVGTTRVFMKSESYNKLEEELKQAAVEHIKVIQIWFRCQWANMAEKDQEFLRHKEEIIRFVKLTLKVQMSERDGRRYIEGEWTQWALTVLAEADELFRSSVSARFSKELTYLKQGESQSRVELEKFLRDNYQLLLRRQKEAREAFVDRAFKTTNSLIQDESVSWSRMMHRAIREVEEREAVKKAEFEDRREIVSEADESWARLWARNLEDLEHLRVFEERRKLEEWRALLTNISQENDQRKSESLDNEKEFYNIIRHKSVEQRTFKEGKDVMSTLTIINRSLDRNSNPAQQLLQRTAVAGSSLLTTNWLPSNGIVQQHTKSSAAGSPNFGIREMGEYRQSFFGKEKEALTKNEFMSSIGIGAPKSHKPVEIGKCQFQYAIKGAAMTRSTKELHQSGGYQTGIVGSKSMSASPTSALGLSTPHAPQSPPYQAASHHFGSKREVDANSKVEQIKRRKENLLHNSGSNYSTRYGTTQGADPSKLNRNTIELAAAITKRRTM